MIMTQKDLELIEKAYRTPYTNYGDVDDMADQADTEEAREWLHAIANGKYHEEEARVGGY